MIDRWQVRAEIPGSSNFEKSMSTLFIWIQPWPIRLVPPGNFRLCLPLRDNWYHSPCCAFWSEWRCFCCLRSYRCGSQSNLGWNPGQNKIAAGREIVPAAVHKNTQDERKQRFRFLYHTNFSKLLFLCNYIRIYRSVYNTKRKKKVLTKLIRSFGMWLIKQKV